MNKIALYFLLFIIYSFMGWLMEVIVTLVNNHKFVNRGFLIGPYCPIYGYGCLLIIILLQRYINHPVTLFFMAILICSVLEYMTSLVMEKLFNARWWDYSDKKFNINGRICLETMLPFGILGTLIIYIVNPFFEGILLSFPTWILYALASLLFIIFIVDNVISFNVVTSLKQEIKKAEIDQTEEITKKIRAILSKKSILHKRLVNAFPHIKTRKEFLRDIQMKIDEKIIQLEKLAKK